MLIIKIKQEKDEENYLDKPNIIDSSTIPALGNSWSVKNFN